MTAARVGEESTMDPTGALWQRYRVGGDLHARRQLLERHLGLVRHVAREIHHRTPAVDLDELVSAGTIGLVRALETFDLDRGLAFSTYAVRRIRGAILDELRSRDWTPRSVRVKRRKLAAAVAALEAHFGREPRPAEVAAALEIDLDTYWTWRGLVADRVVVSIDPAGTGARETGGDLGATLADPAVQVPGDELQQMEEVAAIRAAIARLPEKERIVLTLYFYEELKLHQIAEILHLTEGRISQIRSQALKRLRATLPRA